MPASRHQKKAAIAWIPYEDIILQTAAKLRQQ